MGWKHMMRAGILPGWLGLENMLLSLIAKLALCCRTRSSPGCLACLTCSKCQIKTVHTGCIYTQMQSIHIFWRTAYLQLWL